jgi:hypothetical protein
MITIPRLVFLAAVAAWAVASPLAAQASLGAYGGLNRSVLRGDGPRNTKYRDRYGAVLGIVADFPVTTDVAISAQPSFARRGAGIAFKVEGERERRDSLDVRLDYVSIPVLVKIFAGHRRTFVTGGLDVGFLTKATIYDGTNIDDISDIMKAMDIAAVFRPGVAIVKRQPEITIEPRYAQSFLNVANPEADPETESLPQRFRSTGLQLLLGIMFTLGR